jgi:hypothetical protein
MSDDLEYLRARIPDYHAYGEERVGHDSDMRVRAFVGERLTDAETRLGTQVDGAIKERTEAALMRCMFTDQVFIHNFEHAVLDEPMIAALVRADRSLVEIAERLSTVSIADFPASLEQIETLFDYRRTPTPLVS